MNNKVITRKIAVEKLSGNPDIPRRPLTGYEWFYEIAADGAIYSIRLKRFLKPIFNTEKNTVELEFEHEGENIRISPGKAVAISFFSPTQRDRIADEAFEEEPFYTYDDIKKHPGIERLAYKYDVSEGAIFYILMTAMPKNENFKKDESFSKTGRRFKH